MKQGITYEDKEDNLERVTHGKRQMFVKGLAEQQFNTDKVFMVFKHDRFHIHVWNQGV